MAELTFMAPKVNHALPAGQPYDTSTGLTLGNMEKRSSALELGAQLTKRREAKELSLEEVGRRMARFLDRRPFPKATVSKWEKGGITRMEMASGLALAAVLEMNPYELLGFDLPARSSSQKHQYHRQSITEAAALVGLEWDKLGEMDAPYAAMFRETLELLVAQRKRDVAERGKGKRPRDDTRPPVES
jgi:transcriptional regulator with XRE-family HTH domain